MTRHMLRKIRFAYSGPTATWPLEQACALPSPHSPGAQACSSGSLLSVQDEVEPAAPRAAHFHVGRRGA